MDESNPKYARFVPDKEINVTNEYNLNIPRYIESSEPEDLQDINAHFLPEPEQIDFDRDFRINMYRQPLLSQAGTIGTNCGTIGTNSDTIGTINGIKVTSPEERVLNIMKQNARVTQKELQKELGVSLRTVKRMIAELQDKGYIVRRGNNRSGEWIVKG